MVWPAAVTVCRYDIHEIPVLLYRSPKVIAVPAPGVAVAPVAVGAGVTVGLPPGCGVGVGVAPVLPPEQPATASAAITININNMPLYLIFKVIPPVCRRFQGERSPG
jgi:hypothetical protein